MPMKTESQERVVLTVGFGAGWAVEAGLGVPHNASVCVAGACHHLGERTGPENAWVSHVIAVVAIGRRHVANGANG